MADVASSPFVRLQAFASDHGDRSADEGDDRADREDHDPDHLERLHDVLHRLLEVHRVSSFHVRCHTHVCRA